MMSTPKVLPVDALVYHTMPRAAALAPFSRSQPPLPLPPPQTQPTYGISKCILASTYHGFFLLHSHWGSLFARSDLDCFDIRLAAVPFRSQKSQCYDGIDLRG